MRFPRIFSIFLMFALLISIGCVSESLPPYANNNPPVIHGLTWDPSDHASALDTVSVLADVEDFDGDSLSFIWRVTDGTLIDSTTNPVNWVAPDTMGSYQIILELFDIWGVKAEISDTLFITNSPPHITRMYANQDTASGMDTVRVIAEYIDRDDPADSLTYVWSTRYGRLFNQTANFVDWILPEQLGIYTVVFAVADKINAPVRDSLEVIVATTGSFNAPPAIERVWANDPRLVASGRTRVSCDASDDDGDPLFYSWSADFGVVIGSGGPRVEWQAPADTGMYRINVDVSDGRAHNLGFTTIHVVPDTLVLYSSDFAYDDVSGDWQVQNKLAGMGEDPGSYEAKWDSTEQAMRISGMSTYYSTYGVLLQRQIFDEGSFRANVKATNTQWGTVGFIPKYKSEQDYILIGLNYSIGNWLVVRCVDGISAQIASGWKNFVVGRYYALEYKQFGGQVQVFIDAESVYAGEATEPFIQPTAIGVAVYGLVGTGAAYFDDVRVTKP